MFNTKKKEKQILGIYTGDLTSCIIFHHVSSCAITQLDQEGGLHFPLPMEARSEVGGLRNHPKIRFK